LLAPFFRAILWHMPASHAAEVSALLDRYLLSLDADKLNDEWAGNLFTEHARVEFPNGWHEGLAGLADYHRDALAAFAATQHLHSPAVVDVAGDRASLRANLVSTHVHRTDRTSRPDTPPLFVTGTFVVGEARRTLRGWRISRLSFRLVWMSGDPPRQRNR
jgi:hypothetical protein